MTALELAEKLLHLVQKCGYDPYVDVATHYWCSNWGRERRHAQEISGVEVNGKGEIEIRTTGWDEAV